MGRYNASTCQAHGPSRLVTLPLGLIDVLWQMSGGIIFTVYEKLMDVLLAYRP